MVALLLPVVGIDEHGVNLRLSVGVLRLGDLCRCEYVEVQFVDLYNLCIVLLDVGVYGFIFKALGEFQYVCYAQGLFPLWRPVDRL